MQKVGENLVIGDSGKAYHMNIYTKDTQFNDFIAGVYIISEVTHSGERYIFLDETNNIYPLLKNHPKQRLLDEENYNRISFHMNASRQVREAIVKDLLSALDPVIS